MTIVSEGLKELHDTIIITLLTQLPFGSPPWPQKQVTYLSRSLLTELGWTFGYLPMWPTTLNTILWSPLLGSTHLVDRRNNQVVRLLGSLNWLMSRSLSKAGVLPSSPRREGKPQKMDRWGQGYIAKSLGKCVLKTKERNRLNTQIPLPQTFYGSTVRPRVFKFKNMPIRNKDYKLCCSL